MISKARWWSCVLCVSLELHGNLTFIHVVIFIHLLTFITSLFVSCFMKWLWFCMICFLTVIIEWCFIFFRFTCLHVSTFSSPAPQTWCCSTCKSLILLIFFSLQFSPLLQDTVLKGTFNATLNNPIAPRLETMPGVVPSNHPFLLGV